jgi:hypothetical protein
VALAELLHRHAHLPDLGRGPVSVDLIPRILNSTVFQTSRAAVVVTFAEGYGFPIYHVWADRW